MTYSDLIQRRERIAEVLRLRCKLFKRTNLSWNFPQNQGDIMLSCFDSLYDQDLASSNGRIIISFVVADHPNECYCIITIYICSHCWFWTLHRGLLDQGIQHVIKILCSCR